LGKLQEALPELRKAVALRPGEKSAEFQLATALRDLGEKREADKIAEQVRKTTESGFHKSRHLSEGSRANDLLQSGKAAEAGACAQDQGKFWELHDKMFSNQGKLAVDDLKGYAKSVGMDASKFDKCLDSGEKKALVEEDMKAGSAAGVNGTPAFFINGRVISGAQPFEAFKKIIDEELSRHN